MSPRREAVPFAFVAEADRFRSNVAPPPRPRVKASQILGRTLVGLTVVVGLVGSVLFGLPSLETSQQTGHSAQSEVIQGR